jgi:glycosyltransferase involved in cell wall biosynthesis
MPSAGGPTRLRSPVPVHQFLPTLSPGDAIGNHVLRIQPLLEAFGPSRIYVERADASLANVARDYREFVPEPGSAVVYHSSIGTPMARWLHALGIPVLLDYHNVTPMRFFAAYEPKVAALCFAGRAECRLLARTSPLGMADSTWSAQELAQMGCPATATVPILLDFGKYQRPPHAPLLDALVSGKKGTDVLFVGRISPNKRQEDVVKAFAVYRRHYDAGARLFLVGSPASDRYRKAVGGLVRKLGLADAVRMVGGIPDSHLIAYYRAADVFVSMSEHEGFCVPLVESMQFDLPIVAYAAGAVPETLGDAGILVDHKRYDEIAALIHLLREEPARARLVAAGRVRLEHFRPERHEPRLLELVGEALEAGAVSPNGRPR